MENKAILIEDLVATYGRGEKLVQAIKGVSLEVGQGEIFGLLGPNGAGKTTLLSCLEGLHSPVRGKVRVDGLDVRTHSTEVKRRLGIQLQRTAFLDDLTVGELVETYAALYEVYLSRQQIDNLLARFSLTEQRRKLARQLSGGQMQRLAIILAIANDPPIVLLDEPTAGLDPHARREVWEIIRQLHDDGRTVVITTHAMEEAGGSLQARLSRSGILLNLISCNLGTSFARRFLSQRPFI